ncbi:MAG TPA: ribosomal protein S18-alanine N-acetyltransferase [Anaerolineaceae bacterium]|nr:ribosomal protein S18-alanine N-acetyltransferase [Anaerolineaceae bacterium]
MSETEVSGTLRIRRMQSEDLPQVFELDRSSFSLPWPERSFRFELENNEVSRCWVAELLPESGAPLLVAMIVVWMIADEVHVATLAVSPEYRRQKIAQRLLAHTLIDAYHSGANSSFLEVRRSNQAAITLYQRFGYREVAVRRNYYKDNQEDAILMDLAPLNLENLKRFQ